MKNDTSQHIVKFIEENGPVRPSEIARALQLSTQDVHWHLRKLKAKGTLLVIGAPPKTHYAVASAPSVQVQVPTSYSSIIDEYFSYLTPRGELIFGVAAFADWLRSRKLEKDAESLAKAYVDLCESIYTNLQKPFSTLARVNGILGTSHLDDVFISDFYALPQFGKTILGNLVHAAKTTGDRRFAREIAASIRPDLKKLIKIFRPTYVCIVPHSVPRKVQFLPELEIQLKLSLPKIPVNKLFVGNVPVAQKSLSKTSERIANAQSTFTIPYGAVVGGTVLLVDDAVGSGATLDAIAKMLKRAGARKVIGYAVVGSYKGFDVLPQV